MKVLINRSDAIGDTLLTMPMAQFIKIQYPQAQIYFLISSRTKELFTDFESVSDVIVLPQKAEMGLLGRFLFLKRKIKELGIDHYFYVGGDRLCNWAAFFAGVKFRGGPIHKLSSSLLLNKGMRQKRSLVDMHEAQYNLNLLRPLGLKNLDFDDFDNDNKIKINIFNEKKNKKETSEFGDGEYIVCHPGMSGHTLNWPSAYYARFIFQMNKNYPRRFKFVVSYTPSDEPYLQGLREEMQRGQWDEELKGRIHFYDGSRKGLRSYMGLLKGAKFFLGPSTGPLHLANALGVPVLGIYSPIRVQSARRWGPIWTQGKKRAREAMVATPGEEVKCPEVFQCAGKSCPYYECMSSISVEKVAELVKLNLE